MSSKGDILCLEIYIVNVFGPKRLTFYGIKDRRRLTKKRELDDGIRHAVVTRLSILAGVMDDI
jgi:hypothetical protein